MRELLTIGEAARLVGVTPKAIRNYHKIGLLPEPRRSEAGYRLYAASDLLRMRSIRRLQELGLPLRRVREILGDSGSESSVREVLTELLSEVEGEISALKSRKRRIEEALDREEAGENPAPSPSFERLRLEESLALQAPQISPETLDQEKRLWAAFDAFEWPESYVEKRDAVIRHYSENPESHTEMAKLSDRLAALSDAPEDLPEVEKLAWDMARHFREHRIPGAEDSQAQSEGPLDHAFDGVMAAELSPAQWRCMELVREFMEGSS